MESELHESPPTPQVYLVGAGPGDPGLLTMRAAKVLALADVVLYDYLVNPDITALAPTCARIVCLGRHGKTRIWTQQQINEELVRCAAEGQVVVRLKGGDPNIFGRLIEEGRYLATHNVPFEIVPGISAATAVGGFAGIPLTNRECASAVAFVTGQQIRNKTFGESDFAGLAQFPGTLVVYMGITTAPQWVAALIRNGKDPKTPVALVRKCSSPEQEVRRCTLEQLPDWVTPYSQFPPPVLAIVGPVVNQTIPAGFAERRLLGKNVLLYGTDNQTHPLISQLANLGAATWTQSIRPISAADRQPLLDAARRISGWDWLLFADPESVRQCSLALVDLQRDTRQLAGCSIAALNTEVQRALSEIGIRADWVADQADMLQFAGQWTPHIEHRSVLLLRGPSRLPNLTAILKPVAASWLEVQTYDVAEDFDWNPAVTERFEGGGFDCIVATTSAGIDSFLRQLPEYVRQAVWVAANETIATLIREEGLECQLAQSDFEGLCQAVAAALNSSTGRLASSHLV